MIVQRRISSERQREYRRTRKLTPRLKIAARLYASGAVGTKKAAAEAVGLAPVTFYLQSMPSAGNHHLQKIMEETDVGIAEKAIDVSVLIERLSERAIGKLGALMTGAASEVVQFQAARDLADRGPRTAKIQRHQVETLTLNGRDAKEIAEAIVTAARLRAEAAEHGDLVLTEGDVQPGTPAPQTTERTNAS